MSDLQRVILQLDNLSNLEFSYLSSLTASRIKPPSSDKSLFLDLPRELRDRVYYFAAVNFWTSMSPHISDLCRHRVLLQCGFNAGHLVCGLSLTMVSKQIRSEFEDVVYGPEMIQACYKESPSMSDVAPEPRPVDMSIAMMKTVLQGKRMYAGSGGFLLGGLEGVRVMKSLLQSKRMFRGPGGFTLGGLNGVSVTSDASEEFQFFGVIEASRGEARFLGFMELVVFNSDPEEYSYDLGLVFGARNKHQRADKRRVQAWIASQRHLHSTSYLGHTQSA